MYCPDNYCFNGEKGDSLDGYVTTPRSIYVFGKCGGWLFVQKVPFMLQEHVKKKKTDKARYFFAKKSWFCYPSSNCSLMSHFNQPNIERRNFVRTTKYKRLLEMCIVQHVELKSVFTFQPIKWQVSSTVRSAKPAVMFWIFLLRTKNQQLCCFWRWWYTLLCKKAESRLRERYTISTFEEISPPITIKHTRTWPKKGKNHSLWGPIVSTAHWLIQLTKKSFTFSFYTLSVYSKATHFSQSPTAILKSLSILDQIQWLWLWKISSKKWQWIPKKILWHLGACCCLKDKSF